MATTGPTTSVSLKANVMFKRGTQSSFNNLSTYQDGCFYLTTDSHRLYIGTGNNKADLVSQSVITYDNWAAIEALSNSSPGLSFEGQFYYAKAENILCTYSNGKWIQINPDHNDDHDTYVKSVSVAKNAADTVKGKKLVYDVKIAQAQKDLKGNTEKALPEVSGQLTISAADLDQIATHTNVGMQAEKSDSKVYLKNSGTGANAAAKVELAGGGSVSVSTDGSNKITISGIDTTYSLNTTTNTTGAKVNLQNQNGLPAGSFAVEVDGNALTVNSNTSGKDGFIKLAHAKPLTSNASYIPSNATTDASGYVKLSMPAVLVNEYGHVTAVGIKDITLLKDKDTKVSAVTADSNGRITVTMITNEETGTEKVVDSKKQVLYHKITVNGAENTVYNQGNLGSFYSSDQVDALIADAKSEMNAMTYCGTTTNSAFGQIKGPQKGDTYKAAESFTIGSGSSVINVNTGDLIIYNGADVAAGTAGDTAKWEVIPSGDDIDTTYKMQLDGTTIQLKNEVNNNIAGQVAVKGTNGISVTNSGGLSIGHANIITAGSASGTQSGRQFTIPTINYDEHGHITSQGPATTIEFPVDKDTTYTFSSDAANKKVSLKSSSGPVTGSLQFKSSDNSFDVSMSNTTAAQPVVDLKLATVDQRNSDGTNISYSPLSNGVEQKFTVAKANVDKYGRVTGFENQTITLNTDQLTYNVSTDVDNNILSVESSLTRKNTTAQSKFVKVKSDSLAFSKSETEDVVSVDLVWGTF